MRQKASASMAAAQPVKPASTQVAEPASSQALSQPASTASLPYPPQPIWNNSIVLTSKAFSQGQPLPQRYTADGANVSPPLNWSNLPSGTKEVVIMMEDPDGTGGNFSHWILYGLSPDVTSLPEEIPAKPEVDQPKARQGRNSMMMNGYLGPAPVPGSGIHHYTFRIFAMDKALPVKPGSSKEELQKEMYTHVLSQGVLMGTYGRPVSRK